MAGEDQQVPDTAYDMASQEFSETELTQLTLAIVAINAWNRFNVAFHTPAGNYKSAIVRKAAEDWAKASVMVHRPFGSRNAYPSHLLAG